MIEVRPTTAPKPPYRGPISTAFDWIVRAVTDDAQVKALVHGFERVAGPIELAACLGKPTRLPWLYVTIQASDNAAVGSGYRGKPTLEYRLQVALAVVVAGTDPTSALRAWDAVHAAIFDAYRTDARLAAMWAAGISRIDPESAPSTLASGPEQKAARSAALGTIRVTL